MKRTLGSLLLVLCGCPMLAGCPMYRTRHPPPLPMPAPIAIPGINSPYDDFSSADARLWYRGGFIFSSNRGSQGANFDLYETTLRWSFPQNTPGQPTPLVADEPKPVAPELMSDADERGPIILPYGGYRSRLVFASNRAGGAGGLDFYVVEHTTPTIFEVGEQEREEPRLVALPLVGLNTADDDAYLTEPIADHQLLFASTRRDHRTNDIYVATWDTNDSLEAVPRDIRRIEELSSAADDTAPSVYEKTRGEIEVVFVSSRTGALGEHDLYCSRYVDTRSEEERERRGSSPTMHWTPPVHLEAFSSPRDEYRPIVMTINTTRFLIFSSTREGGQGGYDLYIVGYAGCPRGSR
jgi:hypothetical protein